MFVGILFHAKSIDIYHPLLQQSLSQGLLVEFVSNMSMNLIYKLQMISLIEFIGHQLTSNEWFF